MFNSFYSLKKAAVQFLPHFNAVISVPQCHSAGIKVHNVGSNGTLDPEDT